MKITIFSEELRKCLDAAGLSDCGENDTWNYWYQRLMNAYNESVERQIMTEQAENSELRVLLNETLARLAAANEAAGGGFMDARYCELLESYEIEVGE